MPTESTPLVDQLLAVLDRAADEGLPAREIMVALEEVRRRWLFENIDRVVTPPE